MQQQRLDRRQQQIQQQDSEKMPVSARKTDDRGQEISEQQDCHRQQGGAPGLPRDDLFPEMLHDSPRLFLFRFYCGRRANSATISATSVNVPSGDNSRKAWRSAVSNSSARAPNASCEQRDMEKARPTISSAVSFWRIVTDRPSSWVKALANRNGS